LQRHYRVRGPDLLGRSEEEQGALMLAANGVLQRLGGRWMLQSEAQRTRVKTLPALKTPYIVTNLMDEEHRTRLLKHSRETTYALTLSWLPPQMSPERGIKFLMRGPGRPTRVTTDADVPQLGEFIQQTDFFMGLLRGMLAQCASMNEQETLTYLHNCVSDRWYPVGPLASWLDLDQQLCDTDLDPAGWYPELGRWHIRTCSLYAYPAQSLAGIMRHLEALALDFRWCTRCKFLERHVQESFLRSHQRAWIGEELTFMDRVGESASHEAARVRNTTATLHAEDVDATRQEIGMGLTALGDFTSTVTVWDEDPDVAEAKRELVMEAFAQAGFTMHRETRHQTAAWFSSFPGDWRNNEHKSKQDSLFLAQFCPGLNAMWPGPERDEYLKAGPWFYAQTEYSSLFRVVAHLRSLAHFLLLGNTQSGKSTLGNFMRGMWMQYIGAQAKVFDLDRYARLLTLLLGGQWLDLGSPSLRLQPLRHIDDPERYGAILNWVLDLCDDGGVGEPLLAQQYVNSGLQKLAQRAPQERTFDGLLRVFLEPPPGQQSAFQRNRVKVDGAGVAHLDTSLSKLDEVQRAVRWVLERYASGGEYGGIFSGTEETGTHPVQTFEMSALLEQPRLFGPVIRYIMLDLEQQMDTNHPMFLLFDDAALTCLMPDDERQHGGLVVPGRKTMEERADQFLQTRAKKNVAMGLATHSVDKITRSRLGRIILESCKFRYYLPNRGALQKHAREVYDTMGLTETSIATIASMQPQREVLFAHEELGMRRLEMQHGPFVLDCIARNSADDHVLMDRLYQQEGPEGFAAAWFRATNHPEAAEACVQWQAQRQAALVQYEEELERQAERVEEEATLGVGE
jgi:type IV secretion system protein VirB4